jgi:putative polyhydroxyalkanoate system protein
MATIDMRRGHNLSVDIAKTKAEQLAQEMQSKFDLEWRWDGDRIRFESVRGAAKGTTGQVSVTSSEVRVEMDLPFLLRALKGTISSRVQEKLEQLLG